MQFVYQAIAGALAATFIAVVYYLMVLWQFPQVPLTSGYWLGASVMLVGMISIRRAKTISKRTDGQVIVVASVLVIALTFILTALNVNI